MLKSSVPTFFKSRRQRLTQGQPDSVFLFPAAPEVLRNPDVPHPYRQETNFYYLTGFDEPESFLVVTPTKTHLFVRPKDPEMEIWEGERYGIDGALKVFGVDEAYWIDELPKRLPDLIGGVENVFYRMGHSTEIDRVVMEAVESARRKFGRSGRPLATLADPLRILGEMRLFKAPEEVENLKRACILSAEAHIAAMKQTRVGMNEFEIEALFDYECRRRGASRMGYGSIVAGGKNSTCLHYRANNEPLRDGDLLLIDAAAEFDYYTSDITRTFPVGSAYSKNQAALYDIVLRAQKETVAMAKPGVTLPALHRHSGEVLAEGLLSLGLLKGKADEIVKSGAIKRFFPHGTSHWLGMDVHDVGLYLVNGEPRPLEAGMCFTVEPGIYVQPGDKDAPEAYRGIGIRIEDDILITKTGNENLTHLAPKERAEIESLRK